jgi:hypothetical protein
MKKHLVVALACLLASCESNNYAPPVTPRMAGVGARQHVDVTTLCEGRALFVSRCIECHTLPIIWHYQPSDWSGVVDEMAERSNLKPAERDAIVAYILATRQM